MASEIVIDEGKHEVIDRKLVQAIGIIRAVREGGREVSAESRADALWAAEEILDGIHDTIGRF